MPVPPVPVQVLQRAQQVWHAQQLPPYVQFTSRVQDRDDPVLVIIRTSDGAAYTRTLPQNPDGRVYVAPGVRLTGPYGAPLGFCVSMVHCSGVLQADPFSLPPAQPEDQKVIASVHAYADAYAVSFGPSTRFHGRHVYDLVLQPRYDPRRYEIRDMLIDASDYRMWQITYEVPSGQSAVTIRYDFGPVPDSDTSGTYSSSACTRRSGRIAPPADARLHPRAYGISRCPHRYRTGTSTRNNIKSTKNLRNKGHRRKATSVRTTCSIAAANATQKITPIHVCQPCGW